VNWTVIYEPPEYTQVMKLFDNGTGYAAGGYGTLYKTTDWGNAWHKEELLTTEKIWDIYIRQDGSAWIAGDGFIMRHSETILYTVPDVQHADKFLLYQNYPNPFNPVTLIRFSIIEGSRVSLKIYSVTGEEITTLVDENKSRGTYEVEFNAAYLSSGIYYYLLKTDSYIDIKKMILIK